MKIANQNNISKKIIYVFTVISVIIGMIGVNTSVYAATDGFSVITASDYNTVDCNLESNFSIYNGMTNCTGTGNYISYKNLSFTKKISYVEVDIATNQETVMQIRLDSYDGNILAEFSPEVTRDYGTVARNIVDINKDISGIHDIYIVWKSGSSNFKQLQFRAETEDMSGYIKFGGWQSYLAYPDIADSKYKNEISLLKQLGLLDFITEKQFMSSDIVTKAEFSKAFAKILSDSEIDFKKTTFKDVPKESTAHNAVEFLVSEGIIKDSGDMFYPDDSLTAGYLAKNILKITDEQRFSKIAENDKAYVLTAASRGIFKGIEVDVNSVFTREQFCKILYNIINLDYEEKVYISDNSHSYLTIKGILNKYRHIYSASGTVTSIPSTGLSTPESGVSGGQVKINDVRYTSDTDISLMLLGYYCDYYYTENSEKEKTLMAIVPKSSLEETVIKCDIKTYLDSVTSKVIKYYDNSDKTKQLKIDNHTYIIYNGKAVTNDITYYLNPRTFRGMLKYIENSDGTKCVIIDDCYNFVVKSFDSKKEIICDKITGTNEVLSGKNYTIYKNGRIILIDQLNVDDVLMIYKSNTGSGLVRIFVYEKSFFINSVETVTDDYITIDEDDYRVGLELTKDIYCDLYAKFFVNDNNEIVYYELEKGNGSFIGSYINFSNTNDESRIKIKTSENKKEIYYCSDKVYIDGVRFKDATKIKAYLLNVNKFSPLIYKFDNNGNIKEIDTYLTNAGGTKDKLKKLSDTAVDYYYRPDTRMLIVNGRGVIPVDNDALLFSIWSETDEDENSFDTVTDNLKWDSNPTGQAYSVNGDNKADIFVWTDRVSNANYGSSILIVQKKLTVLIDEEPKKVIEGYCNGVKDRFYLSDIGLLDINASTAFDNASVGDVFDITYERNNAIDKMRPFVYADGSANKNGIDAFISDSNPFSGDGNQTLRYTMGKVVDKDDSYIIINIDGQSNEYVYTKSASCFKYYDDNNDERVFLIDSNSILVGDTIAAWFKDGVPKSIFAYER